MLAYQPSLGEWDWSFESSLGAPDIPYSVAA
jgi:hypothetical protein